MNTCENDIRIIDVYPGKAQYLEKDRVSIFIELHSIHEKINVSVCIRVCEIHREIINKNIQLTLSKGLNIFERELFTAPGETKGYGVDIEFKNQRISTAFDVARHWSERPRYGFLSDFYDSDEEDFKDIIQMNKYHLNVIQFYDWMYKHEKLVPKNDYYVDLLGRKLSRKAVMNKIEGCRKYGMKTMAYGAIYAASQEFYKTHGDWALYTNDDKPHSLSDWLYIMNISRDSPWFDHIINEYRHAVRVFGFDGIHMDTYGFPKTAFSRMNGERRLERLDRQFPELISETRKELRKCKNDIGLIFNAVSNWGIMQLAKSELDTLYIEVWPPQDRYVNLYCLINRAKELGNKQVVLAAYYKFFKRTEGYSDEQCRTGFLLATSVIFASGGFQILLGEENGILTDPYYVNYEKINDDFERVVRNYYDFSVRYGNLLFSLESEDCSMTYANGINEEVVFSNYEFSSYPRPDSIWTIVKKLPGYYVFHLINFNGITSDIWNEGKEQRPVRAENIEVAAIIDEGVKGVWMASPDRNNCISEKLGYEYESGKRGNAIKFKIPVLDIWNLIYVEIEQ